MNINFKTLGYLLVGFSIVLLLVLTFVKIDFDEQSGFLCEKFHENQWNMQECPAHKSNASWMIVSAFGVGFLILGIGMYMIFLFNMPEHEQYESGKEFKQVDISKLSHDEKKVYENIKSKQGSAYQSDLIKETGFTKVKITRILDKLESAGILERKRRGMTNIIVLK